MVFSTLILCPEHCVLTLALTRMSQLFLTGSLVLAPAAMWPPPASLPGWLPVPSLAELRCGTEPLSARAGCWGVTFRKMPASVLLNPLLPFWKQIYNWNDKETQSRKRLLIKAIIPVMVWESQSHNISAWENSRSFQSLNTVCFGDDKGPFLISGSHENSQESNKKKGFGIFFLFKKPAFPYICLILE